MSDAVMVPRERDEAFCEAFYDSHLTHALDAMREGTPYQINADGAFALIRQAAEDRRALKALAASPSVGGWGEPVAWQRRMRNTSSDASDWQSTWSEWKQCTDEQASYARENGHVEHAPEVVAEIRPLYAAPASVSTGSRPQEAVPTEQAGWPVLADRERLAFLIRCSIGECIIGPSHAYHAADFIISEGREQPADGCSSNEGAGK